MQIISKDTIILRLPPNEENILFIYQTFGITQYLFFDKRFASSEFITKYSKEINLKFYNQVREKCLKIKEMEVILNLKEFIFFAKTIDFVSKCFIGKPREKIKTILTSDFVEGNFINETFDFENQERLYLTKATSLLRGFRYSCKNEELLKYVNDQLDWEIEI